MARPPTCENFWQRTPLRPGRGSGAGRAVLERATIHIPDVLADREYELAEAQKKHGVRSLLAVPMLSGSSIIGVFVLLRTEIRPFTDKDIELVTTLCNRYPKAFRYFVVAQASPDFTLSPLLLTAVTT
jgi:GAF domain-containing protein